jgi:hypothetical protein
MAWAEFKPIIATAIHFLGDNAPTSILQLVDATATGKPLLRNQKLHYQLVDDHYWQTTTGKPQLANHYWQTTTGKPPKDEVFDSRCFALRQ